MMKKIQLILALAASLIAFNGWAQTRDIALMVGFNTPLHNGPGPGSDLMLGVNYGQFHYNGLGFRAGLQWNASVANVDDVFEVPLAFAFRTRSRSTEERVLAGAAGAMDTGLQRRASGNRDVGTGMVAGFLLNLFRDMEFSVGVTPGYIAGSGGSLVEQKGPFSLNLDAGWCLNYNLWRFDLKFMPAIHYNLTGNYVNSYAGNAAPLRWFFTLNGGLAFRF